MHYLKKVNKILLFSIILVLSICTKVKASENPYGNPVKIRCTVYTAPEGSITADGSKVREGIVAGKKDLLGYTAILYDEDMNLIGYFEFKDTGGHKGLKNGTRIDIFRNDLDSCNEWIEKYGDYVYMQIVKGDG